MLILREPRLETMRTWLLAIIATALGVVIAAVDSGASWDDTGITAGAVLVSAFIISTVACRRPWLWALLVGIWVPAIAIMNDGNGAAFLALVFALVGAYAGHAVSRVWRRPAAAAPKERPNGSRSSYGKRCSILRAMPVNASRSTLVQSMTSITLRSPRTKPIRRSQPWLTMYDRSPRPSTVPSAPQPSGS